MRWPVWWGWELELTRHVKKRMELRGFTEVELRGMLERAAAFRPDVMEDRYVIETRFRRRRWEVIVEPVSEEGLLLVITAYRRETK